MSDNPFEQRRAERCDALNLLDYEIFSPEGETIGRGVARTLNVSATGLLLETGEFFEAGTLMRITLELREKLVEVTGRVAYSRPVDDQLTNTGVHFVEFADEERRIFLQHFERLRGDTGE